MKNTNVLLDKSWKVNLILFVCSFAIYFLYFHHIFLNINSILSSITLDSLKNYYTYAHHIKNDADVLQFSGMNYPYGEHIIYTDCQPILTFVLRLFPFTHPYLIGIMHSLMFLSFIVTPLILNKILRLFDVDKSSSFFISLAIALLSPQFLKINGGHFALAYGCLVPLSILFSVRYLRERTNKTLTVLFLYNSLLFLLHPYMGFCLSLFCFLSIVFFEFPKFHKGSTLKNLMHALVPGVLPLGLFKLFMSLTDQHVNRTTEPFGSEMMVENLDSILSPVFGPFKPIMELLFPNRAFHFEGHSYLGFFTILLSVLFLITLPFTFKKLKFRKELTVIFLASLVFLFVAFGYHLKLFDHLHIKSAALNQFRAVCRFAWIFYFTLPLFVIISLYDLLKIYLQASTFKITMISGSLLFFSLNLWEANGFFTLDNSVYWKYSNFFREDLLDPDQKMIIENIKKNQPQAILPLPVFHGGSEMYDRYGSSNSMLPSMIYSYHTNTPIFSTMLSRTSITETETMLELLNSYKREKPITKLLSAKNFFVITTTDSLMQDEKRLLKSVKQFKETTHLKFGYLSLNDLLKRKTQKDLVSINNMKQSGVDSNAVVYIHSENRKPFTGANIQDYETIFVLDSNKVKKGSYVLSFHYYYTEKVYRSVACDLIVTRANRKDSEWQYIFPVRVMSGFYKGFSVFECKLDLRSNNKYEFILKGHIDRPYRISDFILRPEQKDVILISGKDTVINNFPVN